MLQSALQASGAAGSIVGTLLSRLVVEWISDPGTIIVLAAIFPIVCVIVAFFTLPEEVEGRGPGQGWGQGRQGRGGHSGKKGRVPLDERARLMPPDAPSGSALLSPMGTAERSGDDNDRDDNGSIDCGNDRSSGDGAHGDGGGDSDGGAPPRVRGWYAKLRSGMRYLWLSGAFGALLFIFLRNARPTASLQWELFFYKVLPSKAAAMKVQSDEGIFDAIGRLAGACLYGLLFRKLPVLRALVITILLSSAVSASQIILARGADIGFGITGFVCVSMFISSAATEMSLLATLVLVTVHCPPQYAGAAFAVFSSALDFGDAVGSWITAPVVDALDVGKNTTTAQAGCAPAPSELGVAVPCEWRTLWVLLAVCVACNAATVLFIPIVHVCRGRRGGETKAGKTRRKASRVSGSGGGGGGGEESLLEQGDREEQGVGIRME